MTRKWFIRGLYLFNIVLLLGICATSMLIVTEKSRNVVTAKVASLCTDVAQKISVDGWSVQDAQNYAIENSTFADQAPSMKVYVESGVIWLETDSPRAKSGLLTRYFKDDDKINCTTIYSG